MKLADFGLARVVTDAATELTNNVSRRTDQLTLGCLTAINQVITMWYRPPEILLGAVRLDSLF